MKTTNNSMSESSGSLRIYIDVEIHLHERVEQCVLC